MTLFVHGSFVTLECMVMPRYETHNTLFNLLRVFPVSHLVSRVNLSGRAGMKSSHYPARKSGLAEHTVVAGAFLCGYLWSLLTRP